MRLQHHCTVLVGAACLSAAASALGDIKPHAGMLRYPDVGRDKIVFVVERLSSEIGAEAD